MSKTIALASPEPSPEPIAAAVLSTWLNEASLVLRILIEARLRDIYTHHDYRYNADSPGFPDLVLAGKGGVAFIECKTNTQLGTLSVPQARWAQRLRAVGAAYHCFTPDDWHCGLVQQELDRIAEPQAKLKRAA